MNAENTKKLYYKFLENSDLTTSEILSLGFTSKDITSLVDKQIITRVKRGTYQININSLFSYGKQLIYQKQYFEAFKFIKKCYELNPDNLNIKKQLIISSLDIRDYNTCIKCLQELFLKNSAYYTPDYLMYFYLLNYVVELPEEIQNIINNLKREDILLKEDDDRYSDLKFQNRIRNLIYLKQFQVASSLLNNYLSNTNYINVYDVILRCLLNNILDENRRLSEEIFNLVNNKEYEQIKIILKSKELRGVLNSSEEIILQLVEEILTVKESRKPSVPLSGVGVDFKELIKLREYELAYQMHKKYLATKDYGEDNNVIHILLKELISINKTLKDNDPQTIFNTILNDLIKNDLKSALLQIKNYLSLAGKEAYEYLIAGLIKIAIIEHDFTFAKVMLALSNINENYVLDIAPYIGEFYMAISQNKLEIARIYLDIINKSANFKEKDSLLSNMNAVLVNASKSVAESPKATGKATNAKSKTKSTNPAIDAEKEFVANKYKLLKEGPGIIILKPIVRARRKEIYRILRNYKDISAFSLTDLPGDKKQIVLRYKPKFEERIDLKLLRKNGDKAYKIGDYEECIKNYSTLLQFGQPKSGIYAKLGFAYLKSGRSKIALDFFVVANFLSKEEGDTYDFTELISSLKGEENYGDKKPKVEMTEQDFDSKKHYGISNIYEITNHIIESGLDVTSSLEEIGLSEEQINMILLIYAKEFYSMGHVEKGDEFLKAYKKRSNKSQLSESFADEIIKSKRFYAYRNDKAAFPLTLTLKP